MLNKYIKENILIISSFWYISAVLFDRVLSFFTIPFFTRVLKPYEYGYFSIYMTTISILFIFAGLNIRGSLMRYYHEKTSFFGEFLFTNVLFLFFYNFVVLFLGIKFKHIIANFLKIPEGLIIYIFIAVFFTVYIEMYLSLLNAKEKGKTYAFLMYIKSILFIVLSIIGVLIIQQDKYWGRVYANVIVVGVVGGYSIFQLVKESIVKVEIKHIKYMLLFGVPLILHSVSGYILSFFDRIIINQIVGAKEAGFYSFAYNIAMIMNVFIMGFNKAWIPFFYRNLRENNMKKIRKQSEKYSLIMAVVLLFVGIFSTDIAHIMASKKYYDSINVIPVMVVGIGFVFLYTLYANISFYRKKTTYISINTFIAGTINVILNYKFIPVLGYKIAAYTTVMSYILLFVLHYFTAEKILKEHIFRFEKVVFPILVAIVLIFVILWLSNGVKYGFAIKMGSLFIILFWGYLYESRNNRKE